MLRLAKAFVDLVLWRITPAQLPASWLLLALAGFAVALTEVMGTLLPHAHGGHLAARVLLSVCLPLAFSWVVLHVAKHRERFLQTATALLGVGALAALVLYPLDSAIDAIGADQPAVVALSLLSLVGDVWYLLVCAHIWRTALESGLIMGIVITLGYVLLSNSFEQYLLPGA